MLPIKALAPGLQAFEASFPTMPTVVILLAFKEFPFAHLSELIFDGLQESSDPALLYVILLVAKALENLEVYHSRVTSRLSAASSQQALDGILPLTHSRLRNLSLRLPGHMLETIIRNIRLPALHILKFSPSKSCRSEPIIGALNDACRHPEFWPSLTCFSYGPEGVGGLLLREGDEGFDTLKAAGPGKDKWVRERMLVAGSFDTVSGRSFM